MRDFAWRLSDSLSQIRDDCSTNSYGLAYTYLFGKVGRIYFFNSVENERVNPFTSKSDQFQISPAASPETPHHTVWRAWLFIAYSDETWLSTNCHYLTFWENVLFELRWGRWPSLMYRLQEIFRLRSKIAGLQLMNTEVLCAPFTTKFNQHILPTF